MADKEQGLEAQQAAARAKEIAEQREKRKREFDSMFRVSLESKLGNLSKGVNTVLSDIAKGYEDSGDIFKSIETAINGNANVHLSDSEKTELTKNLQDAVRVDMQEKQRNPESKIAEHPFTPRIDALIQEGRLLPKEGEEIKKKLLLGTVDVGELASVIENSESAKKFKEVFEFLENQDVKKKNIETFKKDFNKELEVFKEANPQEKSEEFSQMTQTTIDLLGANYLVQPGKDGKIDEKSKKAAIDIAFETSVNEIIYGKSIQRSEAFELKVKTIKDTSKDFKSRFEALKDVNILVSTEMGKMKAGRDRTLALTEKNEGIKGQIEIIQRELAKLTKIEEKFEGNQTIKTEIEQIRAKTKEALTHKIPEKLNDIISEINSFISRHP